MVCCVWQVFVSSLFDRIIRIGHARISVFLTDHYALIYFTRYNSRLDVH